VELGAYAPSPYGGNMGFDARSVHNNEIHFDEELTVPANTLTTVLIFTNTIAKGFFYVDEIIGTGTSDACWEIYLSGDKKIVYRTSEQDRTMRIKFPSSWQLKRTDFVEVKVKHDDPANAGSNTNDFQVSLIGHRVN